MNGEKKINRITLALMLTWMLPVLLMTDIVSAAQVREGIRNNHIMFPEERRHLVGVESATVSELVSIASDGTQGNAESEISSISGDGRFVAFESLASNLVEDDTNAARDIFVHDRETGATERVSVASDGSQGNGDSDSPSISTDGRFVAFRSSGTNLVAGDTNVYTDVFVHDRETGGTERVSVASDGSPGNGDSATFFNQLPSKPSISGDGRWVAFESFASNLVTGDTNATLDIFVHDRETGMTERVSVASDGGQGDGWSAHPSISGDGRFVSFSSSSHNLVVDDTNYYDDVFVRDRETGQTERVSVASDGSQGNGDSSISSISGDGRFVAYDSYASNLVVGDTNESRDVFVNDRETGMTERVSVASDGSQGNANSGWSDISADGRFIAFRSDADNLVAGSLDNWTGVFLRDREANDTERVSVAYEGATINQSSGHASISDNGCFVAFTSWSNAIVPGDTNNAGDIFVRIWEPCTDGFEVLLPLMMRP